MAVVVVPAAFVSVANIGVARRSRVVLLDCCDSCST